MKDLNKILYDILLKIDKEENDSFKINKNLIIKHFNQLDDKDMATLDFERYLKDFSILFELSRKERQERP